MNEPRAMPQGQEPPQYLVARLRRAITEDPRTAEMGVQVKVRGQAVFLSGEVASQERCHQLAEVITEIAPDLTVHNDVHVVPAREPEGREELS
jgi:osmotically-inducible protein OsmY